MAHAGRIVDPAPGARYGGGLIVFQGTPAGLAAARSALTGQHLAAFASSSGGR